MTSGTKRQGKFLGVEAESLLTDWVNLPDPSSEASDPQLRRLIKRWPRVFPPDSELPYTHWALIQDVWRLLRKLWTTTDTRHRDWYIFTIRRHHSFDRRVMPALRAKYQGGDSLVPTPEDIAMDDEPPPRSDFEDAMTHLYRNADRLKTCGNPGCPAPYFFAPPKKNRQVYCSLACAAEALKEQKRKWWHENKGQS